MAGVMVAEYSLEQKWARVRQRLRHHVGESEFAAWLKPIELSGRQAEAIVIQVPTPFVREWIMTHYMDYLRRFWRQEDSAIEVVRIDVEEAPARMGSPRDQDLCTSGVQPAAKGAQAPAARRAMTLVAAAPVDEPDDADADAECGESGAEEAAAGSDLIAQFGAPLDPRFTFDSFVTGRSNELAYAAARRVAEDNRVTFNPLFLHGGVGLGKTHLMHAIAARIQQKWPGRKVLYITAERFMYSFIRAVRYKDTVSFKDRFRSVDVLMVDDIHFIADKDSTQEEFFHTFNALVDGHRQIVVSADKSPAELDGLEERLSSRLGWGLVADIHPTNYELRLGVLQQRAERAPVSVPNAVLEYLADKIASNIRTLEGAFTRIVANAELVGRAVTIETVQDLCQDLLRAADRRVTIEEIKKKVADHYRVRLADMTSARRSKAIVRPRQVAMYLCKQLTQRSLPEIGRHFGGRDHTTVIHAIKKIEQLLGTDGDLSEDVNLLRRLLES